MKTKLLTLSLLLTPSLCFANDSIFEKECTQLSDKEYRENVYISAIFTKNIANGVGYRNFATINNENYSIDITTNFYKLALMASLLQKPVNVCLKNDKIKGIELGSVAFFV